MLFRSTQTVEDTVRRTEVEVERVGGDESRGRARSDGGRGMGDDGGASFGGGGGAGGGVGTGREQIGATQVTPAGAMGSSGPSGAGAGSMTGMAMGSGAASSRRSFADLDD